MDCAEMSGVVRQMLGEMDGVDRSVECGGDPGSQPKRHLGVRPALGNR